MTQDNNSKKEKIVLLKEKEVKKRLEYLEEWSLSPKDKSIVREIEFNKFKKAIGFVNELAKHSEEINHYPKAITIKKRKVKVKLTTDKVDGLTKKDFALAKEIDFLANWKVDFQKWVGSTKVIAVLIIILSLILLWGYLI